MISEWLKVMMEEISSKKAEAQRGCAEEKMRSEERARSSEKAAATEKAAAAEKAPAAPNSGTDRAQG